VTRTATKTAPKKTRPRKPPPVVRCEDVGYVYDDGSVALEGVDLAVRPGEIVGVTGATGSGKSTLMRLLDGALSPTSGTVDVGEVGWLVPALGIDVETAYRLGANWVEFSLPHERLPAVVLADEPVDGVADLTVVAELHDALLELRDRGAGVVVATHCADTLDEVCDRVKRFGRLPPGERTQLLGSLRAAHGPEQRLASLDELEGQVSVGALAVLDTKHGAYVLLPRLQWQNRQFGTAAHWVIIDSPTMRRLWRRADRRHERRAGPRVDGRRRLLDFTVDEALDGDDPAHRRRFRFGGDAALVEDGSAHAWWPGLGQLRPWLAIHDDEEAFATHTSYTPPHPLALTPDQCDELIAFGKDGLPQSRVSDHRANEDLIDEQVPRATRQQIVLALRSANASWWGFDLDDFRGWQLKRYGPGQTHSLHVDLAPTVSTRKLVASIQLSDSDDYAGGDLVLHTPGLDRDVVVAPRAKGSVIVYPTWTPHEVQEITEGERWSIVVQCYGPRFR
jgi:hypothetical protein